MLKTNSFNVEMEPISIQVMSDLHLETHASYNDFDFGKTAQHLALLGDIGHVYDNQLFEFLEKQLERYRTVFYLLGNHEPYHMSWTLARTKMLNFQQKIERRRGREKSLGVFVFLDQTRFDLSPQLTILGCTLYSYILPEQEHYCETRLVDFRDISRWTVDDHIDAHESDLKWLNAQVSKIAAEEPSRFIIIFTHHSPSTDTRSIEPKYRKSEVSSGFSTDLSKEYCWTQSPPVIAWGYGHTHYNCDFQTADGKRIFANQKGYRLIPQSDFSAGKVFEFTLPIKDV